MADESEEGAHAQKKNMFFFSSRERPPIIIHLLSPPRAIFEANWQRSIEPIP